MKQNKKKIKYILLPILILCVLAVCFYLFILYLLRPVTKLADLSLLSTEQPIIMREEPYGRFDKGKLTEFPQWDSNERAFIIDLNSCDISGLNLNIHMKELMHADFNTRTMWPSMLPPGFEPDRIMELGKNPGLGIHKLHERGIDGRGVNIAIIDQELMSSHLEYRDNLMLYEILHGSRGDSSSMHGPAVASIAVGKTVGVAPGANIYYIASIFGTNSLFGYSADLTYMAESIYRVLEINKVLPDDEKIRVISISKGFGSGEKGDEKVYEAIEAAKKENVFVITTSTDENYNFILYGLGREPGDDPDNKDSYKPGRFWEHWFYEDTDMLNKREVLLIPMDSRTYASPTGDSDYAFNHIGGLSWTCPWLAGMYALCVQVKPDIAPEEFIEIAFLTGDVVTIPYNDVEYQLKIVINPENIIEYLEH